MATTIGDGELEAALNAARIAGEALVRLYAEFTAIPDAPAHISTAADHAAQELILQTLQAAFPDDAFCAEEATATLANARRCGPRLWIIDPIDGTRGFARKSNDFSVMIGLAIDGAVALGVVHEPLAKRFTFAMRGGGCWTRIGDTAPTACRVGSIATLAEATMAVSRSEGGQRDRQVVQPANVVSTYSSGIKLALVARGEADLYAATYHRFHAWDVCAGQILVEEAGGVVTDAEGCPIRYGNDGRDGVPGILAANPELHHLLVRRVR